MPLFVYIAAKWLSYWSRKPPKYILWFVAGVMFVCNISLLGYLGLVHQRGTIDVIQTLSMEDPKATRPMFLMPCHSTPLYSYLHSPMEIKFLTCEPDFTGKEQYLDEADVFFKNPEKWLIENFNKYENITHIVMYDTLYPKVHKFLMTNHFKLNNSLFHTFHPEGRIGKYVHVYKHHNYNL
ncbi:hypothetical protein L9F63_006702 [Diploptera punctata]|uniref:Mannosyltransferase n=1 Tax=Diploptera punctata TaxID=6984 RepID=A0AAD7Z9M8_DIPPU|nr:hypothetical protein L9F63_006702 [Diploptera punctata]